MNDPLAYGPTGIRCDCGKDAHSNLVPCQPDEPAPLTPDVVNAIVRDMDDPRYPSQITVFCDHCGAENTGDYMVSAEMSSQERLAVARTHLVQNEGWEHNEYGDDFCPAHAAPKSTAPYTDEDLRSAAALMHYAMTTEPNPADADSVLSGHPAWAHVEVGSDEEDTLRESVVELVSGAADVSEWAINLGADGLEPDEHVITIGADDKPIARIHFAFEPDMPDEMRDALVQGIGQTLDAHL